MSGPFTNTETQLIEQINWLQAAEKLTWDDLRYGFVRTLPDVNGVIPVTFSPAFPREIVGLSASLDFGGGVRAWTFAVNYVARTGFNAVFSYAGPGNGALNPALIAAVYPGEVVGFFYLAVGR